ncbi:MAG: type II toxin-antitoxin system VapB family antitoxin [Actinobacteria bacterium]|nr:type II toxin-antitoxin system VapB family antitoxin [Actinomycetota bacterium]MCG2818977.1 type II toxin-antitoxin system VapB family antitoxin [Actinomycetes bacterium]MBU4217817.1 type II toxin-antitoxin system VapB family antitoxin [Actinomycetota bacterium]MBU4359345.1 type II toxin-antitoxin system VapB family antitoxin [Actinomycetota bacterium]MBU4392447.1 type II toxin-antitoxin system VapB family antitoxin [Actinomycetota bacterium]
MSKTTVDIDDKLLEEAKKVTGTTTKKATVNEALRMVARKAKLKELASSLQGTGFIDLTREELEEMRRNRL